MSSTVKRGAYLALATALISGVSVYINSFGVKQVPDPFVFTTAKNLLVGLGLAALTLFPMVWGNCGGFPKGSGLACWVWALLVAAFLSCSSSMG